ncbi:hypothetical protein [Hymenobacter sp. B81]|uniref:hypothetical protein n=1 Tax=Hymenobacter sp. B81 TaxID=3344878 RepID=UPI0037DD1E1B
MKRILFAALLLSAPAAWAQTTKAKPRPAAPKTASAAQPAISAPAPKPDDTKITNQARALTQNLKQALSLTPQQEVKVQEINERSVRQVETARLEHRDDLRKLNALIDDIGQSRLSALKDVLTPAQFARYQQQREKKMGIPNVQGNQGNAVPGMRGE